jgi:hypothetical protein
MRGSRTLFDEIIVQDAPAAKEGKGRNASLRDKRNECLLDRYFFYARLKSLNYPKVIELLSHEFWLCESTIPQIMEKPDNVSYLHKLKQQSPAEKTFAKKWPHLNWAA